MTHEKSHRRMTQAAPAPPPPPELVAEIIRLAQKERLSQSAIAIRIGCTKSKIYHILKNAGVRTVSFNVDHLLGTRRRRDDDGERIEAYPVKITLARVPSLEREEVTLSKHTPGPWFAKNRSGWLVETVADYDGGICYFQSYAQDEANAHLIAAAPEMFEALKDCLGWHDYADDLHKPIEVRAAYMRARAAIAKAEGRS